MKKIRNISMFFILTLLILLFQNNAVKAEENVNVYDGELGILYTNSQTTFRIWSSSASEIKVVVDETEHDLSKVVATNLWHCSIGGDLLGKTYSYIIEYEDGSIYENVLDPYGKYLSIDNSKNIIYDGSLVGFDEWNGLSKELIIDDKDKIIYGLNVSTFTSSESWHGNNERLMSIKGKLNALIEENTKYNENISTGFDYVKNLGVTYVELSKIYDNNSLFYVDKKYTTGNEIYSGSLELKKVVDGYYTNGIGIILSFDFNDFSSSFLANLHKIDKQYYLNSSSKIDIDKTMVKKMFKDAILYWAKEYKVAGIRIDNMSLYDVSFINEIATELKIINENIIIYGEGHYSEVNANKAGENNLTKLTDVKMINGSLNYAMFGNTNNKEDKGILDGNYSPNIIETLKFTVLSSIDNGEVDYSLVEGVSYKGDWGNDTSYDLINYLGTDEGLSLYDKLFINNYTSTTIITQKIILAFGTMMSSGGIPYIYSGSEFLVSHLDASKNSMGNSLCSEGNTFCFYKESDKKVIDWSYAYNNDSVVNSFRSLINFRKANKGVIQTNSKVIKNTVNIYTGDKQGVFGFYKSNYNAYTGDIEKIFTVFNYSLSDVILENMGEKGWNGLYNYNLSTREGNKIILKANSIYIELKIKQPKVNSWITLILVIGVIGLLYFFNISINKKLVEKKGYDIKKIKKKYRPFINKSATNNGKISKENNDEVTNEEEKKNKD